MELIKQYRNKIISNNCYNNIIAKSIFPCGRKNKCIIGR